MAKWLTIAEFADEADVSFLLARQWAERGDVETRRSRKSRKGLLISSNETVKLKKWNAERCQSCRGDGACFFGDTAMDSYLCEACDGTGKASA